MTLSHVIFSFVWTQLRWVLEALRPKLKQERGRAASVKPKAYYEDELLKSRNCLNASVTHSSGLELPFIFDL